MKLYFVRHGRTVWNLEGRFQGASGDSPLLQSPLTFKTTGAVSQGEFLLIRFILVTYPEQLGSAEIIQSQLQSLVL